MKVSGIFLVVLGIILGAIAVTMDVSISTGYGEVNNLGLMNNRSNLTIGAGIAFISGILLIGFSSRRDESKNFGFINDEKKCPYCAEMIKREAIICRYCNKEQSLESCISVEFKKENLEKESNYKLDIEDNQSLQSEKSDPKIMLMILLALLIIGVINKIVR